MDGDALFIALNKAHEPIVSDHLRVENVVEKKNSEKENWIETKIKQKKYTAAPCVSNAIDGA